MVLDNFYFLQLEQTFFQTLNYYVPTSSTQCVAIGVSGGMDSLALTYLTLRWRDTCAPHIKILPIIVDHGVRGGSDIEAQRVAQWLRNWNLSPKILRCQGLKYSQASFRKARYQELLIACHCYNASYLLFAHHQDDVLETVWMRRRANSHWRGLAGMSTMRTQWNIHMVRPLLAWPKSYLRAILEYIQQDWIEDPSNTNLHFERTHARQFLQKYSQKERSNLWKITEAYGQKRYLESIWLQQKTYAVPLAGGYEIALESPCFQVPCTQGAWLLSQWLESVVPSTSPLKKASLHNAWNSITSNSPKNRPGICFTLGGCVGIKTDKSLYCLREWKRISPNAVLSASDFNVWDQRFFFSKTLSTIHAATFLGPNFYSHLIPDHLSKYVRRWASASMPNQPEGVLWSAQVASPIFYPPYVAKML